MMGTGVGMDVGVGVGAGVGSEVCVGFSANDGIGDTVEIGVCGICVEVGESVDVYAGSIVGCAFPQAAKYNAARAGKIRIRWGGPR